MVSVTNASHGSPTKGQAERDDVALLDAYDFKETGPENSNSGLRGWLNRRAGFVPLGAESPTFRRPTGTTYDHTITET